MTRATSTLLALALVACATRKPDADSAATASAIDTIKPAVVATPDTVGATTTAGATTKTAAGAQTSTKPTSTSTKSTSQVTPRTARDTAHLGRDSVIKINPRDPSRMIPTKKP